MEITTQLPRKYKKRKMSAYDQIVQEGFVKGIEEGMEALIQKHSEKFPDDIAQDIANIF